MLSAAFKVLQQAIIHGLTHDSRFMSGRNATTAQAFILPPQNLPQIINDMHLSLVRQELTQDESIQECEIVGTLQAGDLE
jgi:hypothetical protein